MLHPPNMASGRSRPAAVVVPVCPTRDEARLDTLVERVNEIPPAPSRWAKEYGH
ncbi:MAG TPA: hypothetical protein VMH35_06675 [Streptosporangiaceae bacterium]|nr:hypothetical protein [Streptosporangiaceae bacterium]